MGRFDRREIGGNELLSLAEAEPRATVTLAQALLSCIEQSRVLVEALQAIVRLRSETEMTYELAYHAMFKGDGQPTWDIIHAALETPLVKLVQKEFTNTKQDNV